MDILMGWIKWEARLVLKEKKVDWDGKTPRRWSRDMARSPTSVIYSWVYSKIKEVIKIEKLKQAAFMGLNGLLHSQS
jgi:hypothetical protein